MALFKLLAGQFIQADPDSPELTAEQIKAGARRPSRTYKVGETVESDEDLVAKHGAEKFVFVSGKPKKPKAAAGAAAPGGQVSSGFQSATGTPEGTVSGLAVDQEADADPDSDADKPNDNLSTMTVKQLRDHAASEEIDLHGATSKEDILATIRAAK